MESKILEELKKVKSIEIKNYQTLISSLSDSNSSFVNELAKTSRYYIHQTLEDKIKDKDFFDLKKNHYLYFPWSLQLTENAVFNDVKGAWDKLKFDSRFKRETDQFKEFFNSDSILRDLINNDQLFINLTKINRSFLSNYFSYAFKLIDLPLLHKNWFIKTKELVNSDELEVEIMQGVAARMEDRKEAFKHTKHSLDRFKPYYNYLTSGLDNEVLKINPHPFSDQPSYYLYVAPLNGAVVINDKFLGNIKNPGIFKSLLVVKITFKEKLINYQY
jgi:hypothetical protein